jgi:zinc protease
MILTSGKTSRLYRGLVNTSLATGASAYLSSKHDPGLFLVNAALAPAVAHDKAEKALLAEVDRVKSEGVTQEEVNTVVQQLRADEAYGRDGTSAVAAALSEWIAIGDWTYYVTYIDKLAQVTPADVQRVARKYLNEDQSTTGWFIPVEAP